MSSYFIWKRCVVCFRAEVRNLQICPYTDVYVCALMRVKVRYRERDQVFTESIYNASRIERR